jgi:molecular chaperone GrpE
MSKNKENKKSKNQEEKQEAVDVKQSKRADKEVGIKNEPTEKELIAQEKDKFLRLFAEFENYKKRTAKERIELFRTANRELMTVLLPVLDDFDRGLLEIKKAKDKELLKGMQLINDKFRKTLEQQGLAQMIVKEGDAFDAEIHQAITQIPAPKKKLIGKIIDTVEQGYKLGEVIIRYPKVVVGK